jgi:hypothetical protein
VGGNVHLEAQIGAHSVTLPGWDAVVGSVELVASYWKVWVVPLLPAVWIAMRPWLQLSATRSECRQLVKVVRKDDGLPIGEAVYLRAYVYNMGLRAAECTVYLDRVTRAGRDVESLRYPLQWTDNDTYEPKNIPRGRSRGRLIDICSAGTLDASLTPRTERGARGFTFKESGRYTFYLSATATKYAAPGKLEVDVNFDAENYQGLRSVASRASGPWWSFSFD